MTATSTLTNDHSKTSSDTYSKLVNDLLLKVQKPGQYLGIEYGHLISNSNEKLSKLKQWDDTKVRSALIYPDLYELGMSNFGTKILYQIINNHPDFLCDRAYAPMEDMEAHLKENKISLWGWESFKPLNEFDLLGFSLSYELCYTNILNMLELSRLNVLSKDRKETFPLVFAGGPATFNPEPLADFIDFFIIGDGEEVVLEISEFIKQKKESKPSISKEQLLLELAQIQGVYIPQFYKPDVSDNYLPKPIREDVPEKIVKRVVNLGDYNQPTSGPIPYLASVQDRQVMEIRRGCDRGCRFCQPGYVYLPVRERTPDDLVRLSKEALKNTGYDEYSLLSLSASDYTQLHETASKLNAAHCSNGVSLSMPSQRADRFDMEIANELNAVRKSGITLAPEAGTERLREVINKGLKEKDIKQAIENVYDSGFKRVKLYFMIGLPTEDKSDLDGIINLLKWASDLSKVKNRRPLDITCTISTFVPKAFTPFQWFGQNSTAEFKEKINYLRQRIRELKLRTVRLNCTEPKIALLEAVMSRGDRRASRLVYDAYQKGAKFDAWDESFNIDVWYECARELGLDLDHEVTKQKEIGSTCPWEIIDSGLLKKFLIEEYNKAVQVIETAPCTEHKCHACGVCFDLNVFNWVTEDKSDKNKFVKTIESKDQKSTQRSTLPPEARLAKGGSTQRLKLPTQTVQKVEIVHSKTSGLRFISHLDVQRLFERAMRRACVNFAYTEGFNPRPKMQWLMPLPLYYESNYELMHLELASKCIDYDLQIQLNKHLPSEFQIKAVKSLNLPTKMPNIENIKFLYRVLTLRPNLWEKYICELSSAIEKFLSTQSLILKVSRKKQGQSLEKEIDIRSLVERLKIVNENPLELELVVLGNTRAELVLGQIIPDSLKDSFLQNEWQMNWKIDKKDLVIGT